MPLMYSRRAPQRRIIHHSHSSASLLLLLLLLLSSSAAHFGFIWENHCGGGGGTPLASSGIESGGVGRSVVGIVMLRSDLRTGRCCFVHSGFCLCCEEESQAVCSAGTSGSIREQHWQRRRWSKWGFECGVTVAAGSVRALWLIASKLAWGLSAGWWKPPAMFFKKRRVVSIGGSQNAGFVREVSLLDLPDLALESVLARLPAASLLQMAGVCKDLRVRCKSDYLWEALVFEKWGKLAGPSAYRNWCKNLALKKQQEEGSRSGQSRFWVWPLSCLWPSSWVNLVKECRGMNKKPPPLDSLMAWYWALETGRFWFPAQVYNREHGHVGFMLSCYDAELSYDNNTDSFRARYPPHGSRAVVVEEGVFWERLRAAPVDTPAHNLHISDCLNELTPGDHIEVQWRRNKEFPYGWWYGVVGHSETCNREIRHRCTCHLETTVWLEFNQYTPGSRWRRAAIDRKNHREEGNEAEGFYGGLRKLKTKEEISIWEKLWPAEVLE